MKKKKSIISKAVVLFITTMIFTIIMAFPVSASAAEISEAVQPTISTMDMSLAMGIRTVKAAAASSGSNYGDAQFQTVIEFFITWIRRIGAVIAFVGGIMFALALKNNDAEQKQNGLLTLVAGFVAAALCTAVDMFDIFS